MKSVYWLLYSLTLAATLPASLAGPEAETPQLPLLDDDVAIRVPVTLFGEQPRYFVVDTGSPFSVIDASYRNRLSPLEGPTSSPGPTLPTNSLPRYKCPDLSVGGIQADLPAVMCADLRMIKLITGEECDGILGLDFLQAYVVSMDFDKRVLTFGSRVPAAIIKDAAILPLFPMAKNHVGVTALLNKTLRVALVIDTGNNSSLCLSKANWDRTENPQTQTRRGLASSIGKGPAESLFLRLPEMQLGSRIYANLLSLRWPHEDAGSDLLGLAFLRRHVVTIDFPKKLLYLQPGEHFRDADEADMSGLHLLREGQRTFVYAVNESSPAGEAGVDPGDTLVKLNGKSVIGLKMHDIRRQLKTRDEATVTLELERDQKQFHVSFQLERFL